MACTVFELYPVLLWCESDQSSYKLLTAAYVASEGQPSVDIQPYNTITLFPEFTGTAVTSLELLVEVSILDGDWKVLPTQTVAAGTAVVQPCDPLQFAPINSRWAPAIIDVGAFRSIRASAKRTGGDVTSGARVRMTMGIER